MGQKWRTDLGLAEAESEVDRLGVAGLVMQSNLGCHWSARHSDDHVKAVAVVPLNQMRDQREGFALFELVALSECHSATRLVVGLVVGVAAAVVDVDDGHHTAYYLFVHHFYHHLQPTRKY